MKLSEIFRKIVVGEKALAESETDAAQLEIAREQPDLSEEEIAIDAEVEVELPPFQPPRVALPEGYIYLDAAESARLHAELLRELPPVHPLFGVPLETFAAREGNDDTLFRYRGNPTRFVLVHLTWLGRTEIDADHPGILFTGTFAEWVQREKQLYGLEPPA